MASNGNKVRAGVHAHEDKMHPGKPKTKMPPSVMRNGKNSKKGNKGKGNY
jgi:hypothetical protein